MLVCIDYDGVICDSLTQQLNIVRTAQSILKMGREPILDDFRNIEDLSYDGFAAHIGIPQSHFPDWRKTVQHLTEVDQSEVHKYSGIDEVLRAVAKRCKVVIITSNAESTVLRFLRKEALESTVSFIYDGSCARTKSDKIKDAAAKFKTDKVFMIGDTRSDIRHGHEAGAITIAVTYGYQSKETLSLEQPHFFADSPKELLERLGG